MKKARHNKSDSIARALRENFLHSSLPAGSLVSSTRDISEQFQVSPLTAHKALQKLVAEDVLFRVRGSGTYLKRDFRKVQRIGIADGSITYLYNKEMEQAQNQIISFGLEYLSDQNYAVQTISYAELANAKTATRLLAELDGLLLSYNYVDPLVISRLTDCSFPVVLYRHEFMAQLPFSQVIYNFEPGIQEALRQLTLRRTDSFIVVFEETPSATARKKTFVEQLRKAGIAEEMIKLHQVGYRSRVADCFRLARVYGQSFLGKIIFTCNDDIAASLIDALTPENCFPGRDFRLLSIGNSEQYGVKLFPQLGIASIDMPMKAIALESCKLLIQQVQESSSSQHIVRVPGHFVMRDSATSRKEGVFPQVPYQNKGAVQ